MAKAQGKDPYLLEHQIVNPKLAPYLGQDSRIQKKEIPAKINKTKSNDLIINNPSLNQSVIDSSSVSIQDYMKRHNLTLSNKEVGGQLPKAKEGDIIKLKEGTFIEKGGKLVPVKDQADSNTAPKTETEKNKSGVGTKGTKITVADYEAYPGYTEEELTGLLEDPSVLRYEKVRGKQKKEKEGVYGKGVTLEEFKARNQEYVKKFKETYGKDIDEKSIKIFQKEYTEHVRQLAKKRALEAGYTEQEATEMANRFAESQGFKQDVKEGSGDPRGVDEKFGEYTSSRFEPIFRKKAQPAADVKTEDKERVAVERGPIKRNPPMNLGQKSYAPWWLQDIIGTAGAFGDMARIQRYEPWQATPQTFLPEGTFYDPARELAANAEQARIQTDGLAAFTDPRKLSARSSQIQGQAMKNAADILGRYNNMNVSQANQLDQQRTQILNTASANRANLDTQLWDKYTIMNQQFDNSKAMARERLRGNVINAVTNRAKTQALNSLYPNFYTDPSRGGFVYNTGYANINPTPQGGSEMDEVEKIIKRFPGTSPKDAYEMYRKSKGLDENPYGNAEGYLKSQGYGTT